MAEVSVDHITCQFFDFRWEEGKKSSGERAAYFLWTRICINTFLLLCIFHLLTTSSHPSLLVPSLFLFFFFHLMNISLASPLLFGGRKAFLIALFFFFGCYVFSAAAEMWILPLVSSSSNLCDVLQIVHQKWSEKY